MPSAVLATSVSTQRRPAPVKDGLLIIVAWPSFRVACSMRHVYDTESGSSPFPSDIFVVVVVYLSQRRRRGRIFTRNVAPVQVELPGEGDGDVSRSLNAPCELGVLRIDPLRFLARCRTRRLNQV